MYKILSTLIICCSFVTLYAQKTIQKSDSYNVVINHEEQYSIFPAEKPLSKTWKLTDKNGSYQECMDYIEEVWTDMRPLSIQKMKLPKETKYMVIKNQDHLLTIWPEKVRLPEGWKSTGEIGSLEDCSLKIKQKGYGFEKALKRKQ